MSGIGQPQKNIIGNIDSNITDSSREALIETYKAEITKIKQDKQYQKLSTRTRTSAENQVFRCLVGAIKQLEIRIKELEGVPKPKPAIPAVKTKSAMPRKYVPKSIQVIETKPKQPAAVAKVRNRRKPQTNVGATTQIEEEEIIVEPKRVAAVASKRKNRKVPVPKKPVDILEEDEFTKLEDEYISANFDI